MTAVPAPVAPRAGKPRNVHGTWWWSDHEDGRVSYCIIRRQEGSAPNGNVLGFEGATEEEALELHAAWIQAQYERVTRTAERRANWGPEELRS